MAQTLEWKTSCGCAKCRPALNYYLIATWPGEYNDDNQSRFINERVHANIQKDGTYSVVPRMWGGMTSASELRAKVQATLDRAKDNLHDLQDAAVERAKAAGRATDAYVHENPWQSIGVAAGVGLLLGMLIARR